MIAIILLISCLTFSCFGMDFEKEMQNALSDRNECLNENNTFYAYQSGALDKRLFCEAAYKNRLKAINMRIKLQEIARKKAKDGKN